MGKLDTLSMEAPGGTFTPQKTKASQVSQANTTEHNDLESAAYRKDKRLVARRQSLLGSVGAPGRPSI